jgi:hypothetical protein
VERAGHLLRRWTDGNASLPPLPCATMIEFHLSGDMRYRVDSPAADTARGVAQQARRVAA